MKNTFIQACAFSTWLSCVLFSTHAAAEVAIEFSGFASIVYAKAVSDNKERPLDGYIAEDGSIAGGISTNGNSRDFNRLGLRMDAELDDALSFTAQFVTKGANDYEPEMDWLFATYNIQPNLSVSVGKIRTPLFMFSDYLDVGYAYQWIAPPFSVYGAPTINSTEGVKLSWMAEMGEAWLSELQVWGGQSDETLEELGGIDYTMENQFGLAWLVEHEWLILRAVYVQGQGTIETTSLSGLDQNIAGINNLINSTAANPALAPFGLNAVDLTPVRDDVTFDNDKNAFYGVGAFFDFDDYFMGAEASRVKSDNSVPLGNLDSYYVITGVRLPADVTLSLTYSVDKDRHKKEIAEQYHDLTADFSAGLSAAIDSGVLPVESVEELQALQQGIIDVETAISSNVYAQQEKDRKTYILGARWDFHSSAALKTEYMYQKNTIGYNKELNPRAIRLGVDLVF